MKTAFSESRNTVYAVSREVLLLKYSRENIWKMRCLFPHKIVYQLSDSKKPFFIPNINMHFIFLV